MVPRDLPMPPDLHRVRKGHAAPDFGGKSSLPEGKLVRFQVLSLDYCFAVLCSSFDPFCKGLEDFSRVCIQSGVAENLFLPGGLAEIAQDIFKGNRCLARVPRSFDRRFCGESMSGLSVPQQNQIIDIEDQGSG